MTVYHRPDTLTDALGLLAQAPMTIAAGCTDLFPATDRRALPGTVLDITGIDGLRGISQTANGLCIGATTSWTDVIRANLPPAFDMLKESAREVGSVQIQNAGTVAGNLCNASPAADGVPCLLALDAQVRVASATGDRTLPLSDFITGPRQTALRPGELLTAIEIPQSAVTGRSRFLKLGARRYLVISIAMVAARLEVRQGQIAQAAIAVGACSAVATRLTALETALQGVATAENLAHIVTDDLIAPDLSPIDDIRADRDYRITTAAELVRRALDDLSMRPKGQAA